MIAGSYKSKVIEVRWVTPSVFLLRFSCSKKISYRAGQFLSVAIPQENRPAIKRLYSFASGPENAYRSEYEICVKYVPGGVGSEYLKARKPGDFLEISAGYGNFVYRKSEPNRIDCFISTGTGIAPIRSILESTQFQENCSNTPICLFGARNEEEILFSESIKSLGVQTSIALSQPGPNWAGFSGRVTDFLKTNTAHWPWQQMNFYLCGNGEMISEVEQLLIHVFKVSPKFISKESFGATVTKPISLVPRLSKAPFQPSLKPQPAEETPLRLVGGWKR